MVRITSLTGIPIIESEALTVQNSHWSNESI